MNCYPCGTVNETSSNYCNKCGVDLVNYLVTRKKTKETNNDVNLLIGYIGFLTFIIMLYLFLNQVVRKFIYKNEGNEQMAQIYNVTNWAMNILDILFLILLIVFLKNKTAKALSIVFMVLRIIAYVFWHLPN